MAVDNEEVRKSDRITLSLFDATIQEIAKDWGKVRLWRWADAVAWIGGADGEVMAILRAYREAFKGRPPHGSESATMTVLSMWMSGDEIEVAQRKLRAALEGDQLGATTLIGPFRQIDAAEWMAGAVPVIQTDAGSPIAAEVALPAATVRAIWPRSEMAVSELDELPLAQRASRQPRTDPAGWTSLRLAFLAFGRAALGIVQGVEVSSGQGGFFATAAPAAARPRLDFYSSAYFEGLCRSFGSAVRSGRLRTAYARKGGGALTDIPSDWWRTDDPRLRFTYFSLDPDPERLFTAAADAPCWIFVKSDDLPPVLDELRAWRARCPTFDGSKEIPFLGLMALDGNGVPVRVAEIEGGYVLSNARLPNFELSLVQGANLDQTLASSPPPARKIRRKRRPPSWYGEMVHILKAHEDRQQRAIDNSRHPPADLTDRQVLDALKVKGFTAGKSSLNTWRNRYKASDPACSG